MFAVKGLVHLVLLISFVDVLSQTIGYQNIEVVERGGRDSFLNPEKDCHANACWEYRSTIIGGNCESDSCCTCRCQGENTTYVEHKQQCMSFANIREMVKPQTDDEPHYYLGKPRKSCTETCSNFGGTCLSSGHGFTNSSTTLSIYHSLNVSCQTDSSTDQYYYGDSPSYFTGFDQGRCVGFKDVPKTINCIRGHNVYVQRLCPCQEHKNCRYWLVEHQETPKDSSSCNKIPIIDIRATGSIRLSICNHDSVPAKSQLLKCTVEEFTHLQGSQWVTVADEGKSAFEVVVEKPGGNSGVLKVEWRNSLDTKYNGIIGFIKVECEFDGGHLPVCFVFKSNRNTETTQKHSTPTTPVATSSKPNSEGNFDLKKRNNETSTTVAVAVTASLVLLIVICALVVLFICRRRRRREGTSNGITQTNPTYGKKPSDALVLHEACGNTDKTEEEKDDSSGSLAKQPMYENVTYKTTNKRNNKKVALPVPSANTYETIDIANDQIYHYADRDVIGQTPKQQPIYNVLEESDSPEHDNAYSVMVKPERQESDPGNSDNAPLYNVLSRDPVR